MRLWLEAITKKREAASVRSPVGLTFIQWVRLGMPKLSNRGERHCSAALWRGNPVTLSESIGKGEPV